MTKTPHKLAYTLFPWVNDNPLDFRPNWAKSSLLFLLHGSQKEKQNRQDFYMRVTQSILAGRRQNWALSYSFCQKCPPSDLDEIVKAWQEHEVEDWQKHIINSHKLLQTLSIESCNTAQNVMLGLAWDILEAYEQVSKATRTKLISKAEGQSWALLLTAMATKYVQTPKDFMAALMRDIHWAYHCDKIDCSLLKKHINKLFAKPTHSFWQQSWDFSAFIGCSLSGRLKQAFFAAARNISFSDMLSFNDFTMEDNLFGFLYRQDENSFALNLATLLHERPYFEYEKGSFTAAHLFWNPISHTQAQEIIAQWLKNTVNIDDENTLNEFNQMIMVYGQNKEMENYLYWYSQLKLSHKNKVRQNIEQDIKNAPSIEVKENFKKDLQRLNLIEDPYNLQQFSATHFAIYDYLDNILFWRNSFLAGYISEEKTYNILNDLSKLIGQNCKSWNELLQKIRFISHFKFAGSSEETSLKLAWLDILEQNPTSPIQNHIWPKEFKKAFEKTTYILIKRNHILSTDIRHFKPSPKLWALNLAAPLITGRQGLLTPYLASAAYASENAMFLRYNLNICTAHDLGDHLDWLQSEGRRDLLSSLIAEYSTYDDDEIEKEINHLKNMAPEPLGDLQYRINQLLMIKENIEAISQCQFWALDIIRYSALIQRAVVANLMDTETAWQHLLSAAIALQHRYGSWEDALWDFFRAWIFDAALYPENNNEIERRRNLIHTYLNPLSAQSFYLNKLKWYMPLGTPEIPLFRDSEYADASVENLNKTTPTLH